MKVYFRFLYGLMRVLKKHIVRFKYASSMKDFIRKKALNLTDKE